MDNLFDALLLYFAWWKKIEYACLMLTSEFSLICFDIFFDACDENLVSFRNVVGSRSIPKDFLTSDWLFIILLLH